MTVPPTENWKGGGSTPWPPPQTTVALIDREIPDWPRDVAWNFDPKALRRNAQRGRRHARAKDTL